MKNMLIATALAAASFLALPIAHADNSSGFFINGNVGQSTLDRHGYDDNDTGFGVHAGYRWALAPNFLLGVEGGYADLGSFDATSANGALGRAELKGWNVGANAHLNVTDHWYLSGRAGWFRGDLRGGFFSGTTPVHVDDTSNQWYAGVGFGYDFSNNVSVGLNYDYYKADRTGLSLDPNLVSVSAELRF